MIFHLLFAKNKTLITESSKNEFNNLKTGGYG